MSHEHIYEHHGHLWDMKVLDLIRRGGTREFMDMAVSEVKAGSLTWMLSALDFPDYLAEVYAYFGWDPRLKAAATTQGEGAA